MPEIADHRPSGGRPWTSALRGRLIMLACAILIPAIAATALLLVNAYQHERGALERQIGEQASALRLVVDRQIGQERVLLHALAGSRYLARGDMEAFDNFARRAVVDPDTWVVVTEPDGRQSVNTFLPPGQLSGVRSPAANSRPEAWSPRQPDGVRISNIFVSQVSKSPTIAVSREITIAGPRTVRLSVTTRAASFGRLWKEQGFPASWTGVVLDARQRVVTRSRGGDQFIGRSASPSMQGQISRQVRGIAETTTLDGVRSITAWNMDPGYGWSFLVAVPRDEVIGAARRSLTLAGLSGLALLACGLGLAAWMASSIARPVEALTAATKAWERGDEPVLARSGVAEIDQLGDACADTARRLAQQQRELRELNASLEARVQERTRALSEATESLVQAQKLEAIGRLTGGVAHDFNNLLMAVSGNLDLLKRRLTDERLLGYVSQARLATDRGAKLTHQLLAFSRKQRLQPRTIDINAAILEARELLTSTLGGAVSVETHLDPGVWPALADPTQLELVILNLAINARDAMPDGGVITIRTQNATRIKASDLAEGPPAGEFVCMSLTDTGSGMSAEVQERVFEPFFTTKAVGQGSGLGLPQVLGLAKQLGGGVELITALGKGTTIKVYLPRAEVASPPAEVRPSDGVPRSLDGVRVLLVDDDQDVRGVTQAILSELGCQVTAADGGDAAIQAMRAQGPFDVALLDFAMPGMSGGEAAERIRGLDRGLPVLMMSGYADTHLLAKQWAGPLLHKPFSASALADEIAGVLAVREPQA